MARDDDNVVRPATDNHKGRAHVKCITVSSCGGNGRGEQAKITLVGSGAGGGWRERKNKKGNRRKR